MLPRSLDYLEKQNSRLVEPDHGGLDVLGLGSACALPDICDRADWQRRVVGAWSSKMQQPIHYRECSIAVDGLRQAVDRDGARNTSVLSFGDNMAEVLATEGGRA